MQKRNLSIDIFRGLTMALMVTVNNFWTVRNVPHCLEHFAPGEDGMGLSDIVFPMFLFAMGMSIPYALENRLGKGASDWDCFKHILSRTLALLVMGAFIVNAEVPMAGNEGVYWLLMVLGFFLIWNNYPREAKAVPWLRWAGILILAGLAVTYRSAKGGLFRASWWGILGLIGWMYLFCATAYLLCRERKWILPVLWGVLCVINLTATPMRDGEFWIGRNILSDTVRALNLDNGHGAILGLGGLLLTLCEENLRKYRALTGFAAAGVLALLGVVTHQGWIISKLGGTLPWCLFVSAISVALYTLLRILEKKGWAGIFKPIEPAGTATLTVYMIPYVLDSFWVFLSPEIPLWLSGWVGILKCVLVSAFCIACTWGLGKVGIKLKI